MNKKKTELFLKSPILATNTLFAIFFVILALVMPLLLNPLFSGHKLGALGPDFIKIALMTIEMKFIILIIFFQTSILALINYFIPLKRVFIHFLFSIMSITLVCLYITSWLQFKYFGAFLNIDSFQMFFHQPAQMLLHARDMLGQTILIGSISIIILFVLMLFMSNRITNLEKKHRQRINITGIIVILIIIISNIYMTQKISDSKITIQDKYHRTINLKDYIKTFSVSSVAPLTSFREDIINFTSSTQLISNDQSGIIYDKQISMDTYLSRINTKIRKKYNVILIEVESLRRDQITLYGDKKNVMPNISKLAESSWTFTNAYTQASHSNYADLAPISSHYPLRKKRTYFYPKTSSYPRLAIYDILKEMSYNTAVVSSQNENWGGMANYLNTGNLDYFIHADNYKGKLIKSKKIKGINYFNWNINTSTAGKIEDSDTLKIAKNWINAQPKNENFFLYMNLQNSHMPYYYPPNIKRKFLIDDTPEADEIRKRTPPKKVRHDYFVQAYSDSLYHIDRLIGRFIESLKKSGQWEKTILIITSDTATQISGRLIGNGGSLKQEVIQVPLIIRVPDSTARLDKRLIQHIDIPPTILGLLSLPFHPSFQGLDFTSSDVIENQFVYQVAQTPSAYEYGIANHDWRLTYDTRTQQSRLFFIGTGEKNNEKEISTKMTYLLSKWVSSQLNYYNNKHLYNTYYPPKFEQ